jgi:hypothetical protein
MKKFYQSYSAILLSLGMLILLSYFDTANAINFAAPIKAKTNQLVGQLKIVGTCIAILGVLWGVFRALIGQGFHALKWAAVAFIGGVILANLQEIVTFMGFTF